MSKKFYKVTNEIQAKWFEEHKNSFEQEGQIYKPFFRTTDLVRSSGIRSKIPHFNDPRRIIHVMSQNERYAYLQILHNVNVDDIYEQFAIPLKDSMAIAQELGVKHPKHMYTSVYSIQTFDYIFSQIDPKTGDLSWSAVAVKPQSELKKYRVLEKLAIQEAYAKIQGMHFYLITCDQLKTIYSENLLCLYQFRTLTPQIEPILKVWLSSFLGELTYNELMPVTHLIENASISVGIDYDLGVQLFYHSLWHKYLSMNTEQRLMLELSAKTLGVSNDG